MTGAICGGYAVEARGISPCPTCGRRRRFYGTWAEWYGWTLTCLGCGDAWQDGERMERPFMRGWRADRIRRAKAGWSRAGTRRQARDRIRAILEEAFREDDR